MAMPEKIEHKKCKKCGYEGKPNKGRKLQWYDFVVPVVILIIGKPLYSIIAFVAIYCLIRTMPTCSMCGSFLFEDYIEKHVKKQKIEQKSGSSVVVYYSKKEKYPELTAQVDTYLKENPLDLEVFVGWDYLSGYPLKKIKREGLFTITVNGKINYYVHYEDGQITGISEFERPEHMTKEEKKEKKLREQPDIKHIKSAFSHMPKAGSSCVVQLYAKGRSEQEVYEGLLKYGFEKVEKTDVPFQYRIKPGWKVLEKDFPATTKKIRSKAKKRREAAKQKRIEEEINNYLQSEIDSSGDWVLRYPEKENKEENDDWKIAAGEAGEQEVEYALKWLEKEYRSIRKGSVNPRTGKNCIMLLNPKLTSEKQEIDHIVVGPQGVYAIETKNYAGKIVIDENENWTQTKNGVTEGIRNPVQQVRRHEKLIKSIVGPDVPVISVICISNAQTLLEGQQNSRIPVLKSELLPDYIETYKSGKEYSSAQVEILKKKIEEHLVLSPSENQKIAGLA